MSCIAYTESRYELGADSGSSYGPWQIDPYYHPWANPYRLTHSWSYSAWAAHRIAWHPPRDGRPGYYEFSAWHPDCGIR